MKRLLASLLAVLWLTSPVFAGNPLSVTIGTPGAGGGDPLYTAFGKINTAVNGISNCFAGTSSPSFSGSPQTYECWWNTTSAPTSIVYNYYDGASWVNAGTLNATAHTFTPQGGATCTGADITGTFPSCTLVTSTNANVGTFGSSTLVPVITADAKGRVTAITTASISGAAPAAGALTGTTMASNVISSSLTGVSALTSGSTGSGFIVALSVATVTGTLACARLGTFTGDVTTGGGSCATSVSAIGGKSVGTPTGTAGTAVVLATSPAITTPTVAQGTFNQPTVNQPITMGDTTSATNAAAGQVGEVLSASNTTVAIASNTDTTLTSKSITAGHWLCQASMSTNPAGSTTQSVDVISVSTAGNTLGTEFAIGGVPTSTTPVTAVGVGFHLSTPFVLYNATSTATLFAVAHINYASSTLTADAQIFCMRIW